MSRTLTAEAKYELPRCDAPALTALVDARLGPSTSEGSRACWGPDFFGVARASAFSEATDEQRRDALEHASEALLTESYFIEHAGIAYASKMTLLATSREERMLYATFAGEEARHLRGVERFRSRWECSPEPSAFHRLLDQLLQAGNRRCNKFLVQVVLEGWGLQHYRSLARGTTDPELREFLEGVVSDEAGHYGAGHNDTLREPLESDDVVFCCEYLGPFLDEVRRGPQSLVSALARACGGFTRAQQLELLVELGHQDHAASRLTILRALMVRARAFDVVEALDARSAFVPFATEDCL